MYGKLYSYIAQCAINRFLISFCYSAFYNVYCSVADVGVARVDYASFILSKHRKAD